MNQIFRVFAGVAALLVLLFFGGFWLLFFSERPPLEIDPETLAGDGSTLNYCELPILDGRGKRAVEIPKGNTPGCGYDHFPLPILAQCTEPLPDAADDLRGLWMGVEGGHTGHVERVEQCGSRVVVTAAGIIHDMGPNSTGGLTSNDTEGMVLFTIGNRAYCPRTSAGVAWHDGVLEFQVLGWGPVVVRRYREGEQLIWEYADGSITRMNRLCQLPAEQKHPEPRGPRVQVGWG
ncbi:hypothetical protein N9395_02030 [Pseudomonadales bacterium]|nr:hypothetical protein [Pseudomonadales bacterium]